MIIPNLFYDKITLYTCPKCGKVFDKRQWAGTEIEIDTDQYPPQCFREIRLESLCETCDKEESCENC